MEVHELEPKLIITIMHGQQHIKICKANVNCRGYMDFLHQYYSNPGEQGCSPALEPEETQQWQLTHISVRKSGETNRKSDYTPHQILCEQIKAFQMGGAYGT